MATKHGFLGLPVISLFLLLQAVFCYYHVRNCSTLVKGYYLDFYLQSSSFKELLLPPFYISSQMRPWQRIASTIHFPQSVWTKYGYSCLSALDVHSDTDIKIFMDVSSIPEPRLNQSSLFANRLSVLYLNQRRLKAFMSLGDDSEASKVCKITLLQQLVYRGNYDVLCETWLNNFVMDCELLYGYFLFQRDKETNKTEKRQFSSFPAW